MLVKQLLSMKSTSGKPGIEARTMLTVGADALLSDGVALMARHGVGSVVVTNGDRRPEGILSERDVVFQLGTHGPGALSRPIAEAMTRPVETCRMGDDSLQILERMTHGRFRHMPVVDDGGAMIGLVSIGDAVSGRLKELSAEKDALTGMIMGA